MISHYLSSIFSFFRSSKKNKLTAQRNRPEMFEAHQPVTIKIYHSESKTLKSVDLPNEMPSEFENMADIIEGPTSQDDGYQSVLYWPPRSSRLTH